MSRWPRARDIVNAEPELSRDARARPGGRAPLAFGRQEPGASAAAGKRLAEGEELLLSRREEVDIRDRRLHRGIVIGREGRGRRRSGKPNARASRPRPQLRQAARSTHADRGDRRVDPGSIGAAAGAVVGFRGQQEAIRQAERAEENAEPGAQPRRHRRERPKHGALTEALAARDEALRNQSLSLSFLSQQTAATGDTEAAILLALEALPKDMTSPDRPYLSKRRRRSTKLSPSIGNSWSSATMPA